MASDHTTTVSSSSPSSADRGGRVVSRRRMLGVAGLPAAASVLGVVGWREVAAAGTVAPAADLASPDEAIAAYLAGVATADLGAIRATLAAPDVAEHLDFVAMAGRVGAWGPSMMGPSAGALFTGLNRLHQTAQVLGQTRILVYSLLTDIELDGTMVQVDEAWAGAFVAALDQSRLAGLTLVAVGFPGAALATDQRVLDNFAALAAVWGADELTERVVLVVFEGATYAIGFTVVRYGRQWRISSQSSALAGTSALGAALPTTAEHFAALTGSDEGTATVTSGA
jgi:hypothetical protein